MRILNFFTHSANFRETRPIVRKGEMYLNASATSIYNDLTSCIINHHPSVEFFLIKWAIDDYRLLYIDFVEDVVDSIAFPRPQTVGQLLLKQFSCGLCIYFESRYIQYVQVVLYVLSSLRYFFLQVLFR